MLFAVIVGCVPLVVNANATQVILVQLATKLTNAHKTVTYEVYVLINDASVIQASLVNSVSGGNHAQVHLNVVIAVCA